MTQRARSRQKEALAKGVLRRRVMGWYSRFNRQRWSDCYALIDPRLANSEKVNEDAYVRTLRKFKARYGAVHPWHVRIGLHLKGSRPSSDPRPFAYVYTVCQDDRHEFH